MFDFFFDKKEYVSCEWLEYGINFAPKGLYHCPSFTHSYHNDEPVTPIKEDYTYDYDTFLAEKKKIRKNQRKNIIDIRCKGCLHLRKDVWSKKNKITKIAICQNTKCNSDCIYCFTHNEKTFYNQRPDTPVFEFIKKNIDKGIIGKDCAIEFGGGEPVISEEFDDILNYLLDNSFSIIKIHSSGIKYSKAIERALSLDVCNLIISPDAGERELFKKIKNVDSFDACWENISKYALAQNKNKEALKVKIVMVPTINDTLEDVKKFIDKTKDSNVNYMQIDIESEWYKKNNENIEEIKRLFSIIKSAEKYAKSLNIICAHSFTVCTAVFKYQELYDKTEVSL